MPAVIEALDVFGLPFSPVFLDSLRLHAALRSGLVPFLNYLGQWTPVVGWDPCRRGFLCYRYPDSLEGNPWFHPADREALFGNGGSSDSSRRGRREFPYHLLAFIPEHDLLRHLHDICGVGLVLGDTAFASAAERRAAYLVEYGDVLYQEHDDNQGAAGAYARAQTLHPSDYIQARMAYLERHALRKEGPEFGLGSVFRGEIRRRGIVTGLTPAAKARISDRIRRGDLGQYLLLNWHDAAPLFFAGADSGVGDSTRGVFHAWMRLEPHNPAALDSLAAGFEARRRWDSAAFYYRRLLEYRPPGHEFAAYRLAWVLFQEGKFPEMEKWLRRCPSFREEARTLVMRGAAAWSAGRRRSGKAALEKSLKLDKTSPEAHAWMERIALAGGDSVGAARH